MCHLQDVCGPFSAVQVLCHRQKADQSIVEDPWFLIPFQKAKDCDFSQRSTWRFGPLKIQPLLLISLIVRAPETPDKFLHRGSMQLKNSPDATVFIALAAVGQRGKIPEASRNELRRHTSG